MFTRSRDIEADLREMDRLIREVSGPRQRARVTSTAWPLEAAPLDPSAVYAARNTVHDGARAGVQRDDDPTPFTVRARRPGTLAEVSTLYWKEHAK